MWRCVTLSVRNDKETKREFYPAKAASWIYGPKDVCIKTVSNFTADLVQLLKTSFGFIRCHVTGHLQYGY